MHENESIYLWLLEEDRKKRRVHIPEERDQCPASRDQAIAYHPLFDRGTAPKGGNNQQTFITADLEQLLKEKTDLEIELHRLHDNHRFLDERAKFLCGRIIQEMRKQNREKKQAVCHLRERIAEMETRLAQLDKES